MDSSAFLTGLAFVCVRRGLGLGELSVQEIDIKPSAVFDVDADGCAVEGKRRERRTR
jgi:hypothetical protein